MSLLLLIIWTLAGVAEAVQDVLAFHWSTSFFSRYPVGSFFGSPLATAGTWLRKYKRQDPHNGPAFWGSTTLLVSLTDAWHLAQLLSRRLPLAVTLAVLAFGCPVPWYVGLFCVVLNLSAFNAVYYATRHAG